MAINIGQAIPWGVGDRRGYVGSKPEETVLCRIIAEQLEQFTYIEDAVSGR